MVTKVPLMSHSHRLGCADIGTVETREYVVTRTYRVRHAVDREDAIVAVDAGGAEVLDTQADEVTHD